jgi:hypothetical protein
MDDIELERRLARIERILELATLEDEGEQTATGPELLQLIDDIVVERTARTKRQQTGPVR